MQLSSNDIKNYFDLVEKARGRDARYNLRTEMIALHRLKTYI
jgi:hypothetical protein